MVLEFLFLFFIFKIISFHFIYDSYFNYIYINIKFIKFIKNFTIIHFIWYKINICYINNFILILICIYYNTIRIKFLLNSIYFSICFKQENSFTNESKLLFFILFSNIKILLQMNGNYFYWNYFIIIHFIWHEIVTCYINNFIFI